MAQSLKHFNVTLHLPNVKKMYSNIVKSVMWPKIPFKVVDVGCGSGRVLLEVLEPLLPDHYSEIVGTDLNEEMITHCQSLKVNPRISFGTMNIESKTIPGKYKNNFDYLFSSYALHYVKDIRQALVNCRTLLKPKGEMVVLYLYTGNPLYYVHKRMCKIDEWKPYLEEFINYGPHFTSDNPHHELKLMFQECGLKILNSELNHDPFESTAENFLELFSSLDSFNHVLRNEKKQRYEMDFSKTLADLAGFSLAKQDLRRQVHMFFPTIVVHARNSF